MKMVKVYLNLSIFTVFLKNRNFLSKIRISKVTDYAALSFHVSVYIQFVVIECGPMICEYMWPSMDVSVFNYKFTICKM